MKKTPKKKEKKEVDQEVTSAGVTSAGLEKDKVEKEEIKEKEITEEEKKEKDKEEAKGVGMRVHAEEVAADEDATHEEQAEEPVESQENEEDQASETTIGPASEILVDDSSPKGIKKFLNKKVFLGILGVAVVVALVSGGIIIYTKAIKTQEPSTAELAKDAKKEEIPEEPKVTAEPTTTDELKRKDLKVKVLNGSGAPGAAGKGKEYLEDLGYKEVEAGNASSYDFDKTEISIKKEKEAYFETLKKDLSESYEVADEWDSLEEDSEFDAVIILGTEALSNEEETEEEEAKEE